MKIAFFSNFLNHHQLPLCQEFLAYNDVEFVFVATDPIDQERLNMGYEDMNAYPFVVRAYENSEQEDLANTIAETYDVVIFGDVPERFIEKRMTKNLLSFRFCERSLKKGLWRRFIPHTRAQINKGYIQYKNKNLYILGASAYTAHDLVLCGFNKDKCFKWGYFPKVETKNVDDLIKEKSKNSKVEMLYAGRLLKWKRVIDTVKAVKILVDQGVKNIHFTIIGDGDQKQNLQKYVTKNALTDYVSFLPFMPFNEVREYMDKADIYVFGSDFYEGWGAVVNEAMNSACSLLVSHAVGSSAHLIEYGKNGFIYEYGNIKDLTEKLKTLVNDADLRHKVGVSAYQTLQEQWNAKTAVSRFLELCKDLNADKWKEGPCSKAEILKNNWIKNINCNCLF